MINDKPVEPAERPVFQIMRVLVPGDESTSIPGDPIDSIEVGRLVRVNMNRDNTAVLLTNRDGSVVAVPNDELPIVMARMAECLTRNIDLRATNRVIDALSK